MNQIYQQYYNLVPQKFTIFFSGLSQLVFNYSPFDDYFYHFFETLRKFELIFLCCLQLKACASIKIIINTLIFSNLRKWNRRLIESQWCFKTFQMRTILTLEINDPKKLWMWLTFQGPIWCIGMQKKLYQTNKKSKYVFCSTIVSSASLLSHQFFSIMAYFNDNKQNHFFLSYSSSKHPYILPECYFDKKVHSVFYIVLYFSFITRNVIMTGIISQMIKLLLSCLMVVLSRAGQL